MQNIYGISVKIGQKLANLSGVEIEKKKLFKNFVVTIFFFSKIDFNNFFLQKMHFCPILTLFSNNPHRLKCKTSFSRSRRLGRALRKKKKYIYLSTRKEIIIIKILIIIAKKIIVTIPTLMMLILDVMLRYLFCFCFFHFCEFIWIGSHKITLKSDQNYFCFFYTLLGRINDTKNLTKLCKKH